MKRGKPYCVEFSLKTGIQFFEGNRHNVKAEMTKRKVQMNVKAQMTIRDNNRVSC
jgi:hypothetical protein